MDSIDALKSALLKQDPESSKFTAHHLTLARLGLVHRAYSAVIPILDSDIYHFNSEMLGYRDHLMYYLYGGMIYMAVKDWDRALLFLEVVLNSPTTNTASMIQVEAYKKWVLVGLLHKGKKPRLPHTTNSTAVKNYHGACKAYDVIAEIFEKGTYDRLLQETDAGLNIWQQDCNVGLIQQVIAAHRLFAIRSLSETYAALPIPTLAAKLSTPNFPQDPNQTLAYATNLIVSGQLNAILVQPSEPGKPRVLRFAGNHYEGPLAMTEAQQHESLARQQARIEALTRHVQQSQRKFELNKEYLEATRKARATERKAAQNPGEAWAADDEILADL